MAKMQKTASLDEHTVKRVARGEVTAPKRGRRRPTGGRNGPVAEAAVHPLAMEAAQKAMRPGTRLRVVSPTEVIVENV